jgi:glycosyltransferase involved in cell wall biosynthesis
MLTGDAKSMKILISAYSCEPGKGSERGVGWNVASEVAKHHEVWVLTRPDESREAIEAELKLDPNSNLHFVYFTLPFWQNSLRWGQAGAMQIHYYLWQIQAYFVGYSLHQKIGFDVIHHVTFVTYSSPSFLSLLPIPFIWGPVGGAESTPLPFWRDFSYKNQMYEVLRLVRRMLGEIDPFTRLTTHRSALIYAATKDTAERIHGLGAHDVRCLPAIGISDIELSKLSQFPPPPTECFRFINIARLLHWKGIHLGLQAFALANISDSEYWIVGEGAELNRLQEMVADLEIERKVRFLGMLSRDEVLVKLVQCSALVHPSLHDSGGGVILEAMAVGRPVLCLDLGGPSAMISSDVGIKIPAITPAQAVRGLADGMVKIANSPELCRDMGLSGQEKVRQYYTWEAKGNLFAKIYEELSTSVEVGS